MNEDEVAAQALAALRKGEGPTANLGIALDGCGAGWADASLVLTTEMMNGLGTAHGGILFTLADTAFAYACNSRNVATVAQGASISFLAPGQLGERVVAEAREAALAGRSGVYDVRIHGAGGRIVAIFQGLSRSLARPVVDTETGDLVHG